MVVDQVNTYHKLEVNSRLGTGTFSIRPKTGGSLRLRI